VLCVLCVWDSLVWVCGSECVCVCGVWCVVCGVVCVYVCVVCGVVCECVYVCVVCGV